MKLTAVILLAVLATAPAFPESMRTVRTENAPGFPRILKIALAVRGQFKVVFEPAHRITGMYWIYNAPDRYRVSLDSALPLLPHQVGELSTLVQYEDKRDPSGDVEAIERAAGPDGRLEATVTHVITNEWSIWEASGKETCQIVTSEHVEVTFDRHPAIRLITPSRSNFVPKVPMAACRRGN